MNVLLWGLQVALALMFAIAGVVKVGQPRAKVLEQMGTLDGFSASTIKLIGTLELLAAVGLILPAATGILPVLTPLAATGLVVLMVLAADAHRRRGEHSAIAVNAVLLALAVVVAWGRFGPYSF